MPPSKKTASVKHSTDLAPKPKKKHAAPPPPPHEKHHDAEPGRKHAKKHTGKPSKKHEEKPAGKHLRRAFEHLGRVEALAGLTPVESVSALVRLAQSSIDQGEARPAADLLRAAEHLGFAAAAAASSSKPTLSPDLEGAIRREFRKLLEAAEEHALSRDSMLGKLLRQTLDDARSAFDSASYRQALELARAAEALASIDARDAGKLDAPAPMKALKA